MATTYTATPAGEGEIDGLDVLEFSADQSEPLPISPAFFQVLNGLTPLPTQLTLDQLKPILLSVVSTWTPCCRPRCRASTPRTPRR